MPQTIMLSASLAREGKGGGSDWALTTPGKNSKAERRSRNGRMGGILGVSGWQRKDRKSVV
jgi:hypothetical protein